ncbi:hypothetical protein ACFL2Q_19970, partial [Thermodesulfobacteriota bacterium]
GHYRRSGDHYLLFAYQYAGSGRWDHKGDHSGWANVGGTNGFPDFIGDGSWHTLGNGFDYMFDYDSTRGRYRRSSDGLVQFHYGYQDGIWKQGTSQSGMYEMNSENHWMSADFVGNGSWYSLGNEYDFRLDIANWSARYRDSYYQTQRFAYLYDDGVWTHGIDASTTAPLNSVDNEMSPEFIGNGSWHSLGNGFDYYYSEGPIKGYFRRPDSPTVTFAYSYRENTWEHKNLYGEYSIGGSYESPTFVGGGEWHALGNGFDYRYSYVHHTGYYRRTSDQEQRLAYLYNDAAWINGPSASETAWLNSNDHPMSPRFIGDGAAHIYYNQNGAIMAYTYYMGSDYAKFSMNGETRLIYSYRDKRWGCTVPNTALGELMLHWLGPEPGYEHLDDVNPSYDGQAIGTPWSGTIFAPWSGGINMETAANFRDSVWFKYNPEYDRLYFGIWIPSKLGLDEFLRLDYAENAWQDSYWVSGGYRPIPYNINFTDLSWTGVTWSPNNAGIDFANSVANCGSHTSPLFWRNNPVDPVFPNTHDMKWVYDYKQGVWDIGHAVWITPTYFAYEWRHDNSSWHIYK